MSQPVGTDHWVYYGDGNAAQILDLKEYIKKETGVRYVKFIIIPSALIEQTYDLIDKQDPNTRAVVPESE